jgi:hypothetical protein
MDIIQVQNYVIENARYNKNSPKNACYFVRFPSPNSAAKIFFSDDTLDLVNSLYHFANFTPEGIRLAKSIKETDYVDSKLDDNDEGKNFDD